MSQTHYRQLRRPKTTGPGLVTARAGCGALPRAWSTRPRGLSDLRVRLADRNIPLEIGEGARPFIAREGYDPSPTTAFSWSRSIISRTAWPRSADQVTPRPFFKVPCRCIDD